MIYKAKKSLGQNFLKSNLALNKIIEAGEISDKDIILEIGPGKGALTEKLLAKAGWVIAVEKDNDLFKFLEEKFSKEILKGKLILIENDILKLNIPEEIFLDSPQKSSTKDFLPGPSRHEQGCPSSTLLPRVPLKTLPPSLKYKIIANIPYNITGAILKKFLTEKNPSGLALRASQPERMVLMVQHEVAKRIIANDKKESLLSISVKAYGEPKIILKVPARYFSPAPKVDSAIICIKNISRKFFQENKVSEENFWRIIHSGFAHKRKKLSGNLKKIIKNIPKELKDKRAEDLTLTEWINLVKE